jgi:hypothetical protein
MKTVGAGVQWDPSAGRERGLSGDLLATQPEANYVDPSDRVAVVGCRQCRTTVCAREDERTRW